MKICKNDIKSILGLIDTTYDTKIDMVLPIFLEEIIKYCKQHFVMKGQTNYIYDDCDMVFTTTTCSLVTNIPLVSNDWIRIENTEYNNGIYQVSNFESDIITINSSKSFRVETITGGIIELLDLPLAFLTIFCNYFNNFYIKNQDNLKQEKIDDYSVTFSIDNISSFLQSNSMLIANYRSPVEIKFMGDLFYDSTY